LLDNDIEIKAGDTLKITAAPAGQWKVHGERNGPGQGIGECQECLDASFVATVTGTVEKVTLESAFSSPRSCLRQPATSC
jgi:hypothetical protein